MNLEEVSILGTKTQKELREMARKINNLPLIFYDGNGNVLLAKAKLAEIGDSDIIIEPVFYKAQKISLVVTNSKSCVKFKEMTPEFLKLIHNETVFLVILKTKENQTN